MTDFDSVTVLLPTLNEAETVAAVIEQFRDEGFSNILVIDGGSTDGTRSIVANSSAQLINQSRSGKGQAVREAVREFIDTTYVLLVDADATYRPDEASRLMQPLESSGVDHVIGNRFANMSDGAMTRFNRFGNWIINRGFAFIHGREFKDILSGYRAFTKKSFMEINPQTNGFGIETELAVGCIEQGHSVEIVPIHYDPRPADSTTNLRPVRDGAMIILTLYRLARKNNPLFFFGSVGVASSLFGVLIGMYVGYQWFTRDISHEVLALLAVFGIIFGVQLVMFGLLSDLIVRLHREQLRRIDNQE